MDFRSSKYRNKIWTLFTLVMLLVPVIIPVQALLSQAEEVAENSRRKVVVLIIDNLRLSDLQDRNLANFWRIIGSGGFGLMNTRTKSLAPANRASTYLTIGMGAQVQIPDQENKVFNSKKAGPLFGIVNQDAEALKILIGKEYPNYVFGKTGETAKQNGITVALIGNADTERSLRESALIAIDSGGKIELGNVDQGLLMKDPDFPWGYRTDPARLLADSLAALKLSDLVFIDFGDTARAVEAEYRGQMDRAGLSKIRLEAVRNADSFLGELLRKTEDNNAVLIVISPTPSAGKILPGEEVLTPVIIYKKGQTPGVLVSKTTKRPGLVANIDISPTILKELGIKIIGRHFSGEEIITIPDQASFQTVSGNLSEYTNLKRSRYVIHGLYVTILVLALAALYFPGLWGRGIISGRGGRVLVVMVLTIPAASFLVPTVFKNKNIYLDLLLIGLATLGSGIFFSRNFSRTLAAMAWLSLGTSIYLITDLLTGTGSLLKTPLGFTDVFTGGRYYGINNDCMGILLGSTVFAMFYFLDRLKANKWVRLAFAVGVMGLVILSQTPGYGANVGGTIAAMTTGVIAVIVLAAGKTIKKGNLIAIVIVVLMAELVIAYLDILSGPQTHAGKTVQLLISQGSGKFLEVVKAKLSLFGLMLILPPWNILLGAQVYVYYLYKKRFNSFFQDIRQAFPVLSGSFAVILFGGLVTFVFNDTGVIATALMFTYLTMPLGIMVNHFMNTENA